MITRYKTHKKILIYALVCLVLAVFLFPIYWMVVSSFRGNATLMRNPPVLYPTFETMVNFYTIFHTPKFLIYVSNSFIVAAATVVIVLLLSLSAGYVLSRYRFPFRKTLMTMLLSIQMFPMVAILISLYSFYAKLNLNNTYLGLILADVSMSISLSIWLLKSFFDTVPSSIDEAARIDGCGRFSILMRVVAPLMTPGMLAVGIYTFMQSWDDYLFGSVLMSKKNLKTLPVGIAESFMGEFVQDYAGMMTLAVVASLPVVILFLFFNRYMVSGLTGGAVKE